MKNAARLPPSTGTQGPLPVDGVPPVEFAPPLAVAPPALEPPVAFETPAVPALATSDPCPALHAHTNTKADETTKLWTMHRMGRSLRPRTLPGPSAGPRHFSMDIGCT